MMFFMPESPVLLIANERYEEAMYALRFYRGENFDLIEDIQDIENYLNCDEGVMTCAMAILGTYFLVLAFHELAAKKAEHLVMVVLYLYMIAYGMGVAPITWCLVAEVPSPGAKNYILAVAFTAFWITAYIVLHVHASLEDKIGEGGVLIIVSGITLIGFILAFLFVVETKQISLYDIQVLLQQGYVAI
ncbi:hypothetical protein Trydic_g2014 [Trypoxylus dichotomus]